MIRFTPKLLFALLAYLSLSARFAYAEGTKQLCPESTDIVGLFINDPGYGDFGGYGSRATSQLLLTLSNPGSERVYFGFARATGGADFTPGNASELDTYFRILDPNGNVVFGPQLITGTGPGSIANHAQAVAGPVPTGGAAGYTPWLFEPAPGAIAGDYVVEFSNLAGTAEPTTAFSYPLFDITVATKTATPTAIPGRLYSKNWAFFTPPIAPDHPEYGRFNRQFRGSFHVYSPRGFVSEVDFLNAGFRPFIFNISFNETGTANGPDVLENIKSVNGALATNPVHKVFLSNPDINSFPNGTYGTILENASYPRLIGCAGSGDFSVRVAVTKPGVVEVLFDQDRTSTAPGVYDVGTADRLLMFNVEPAPNEQPPYVRDIPWDGLDGEGNDIAVDQSATLNIETTYGQVAYHLPVYDAEYMTDPDDDGVVGNAGDAGGFEVTLTRPLPPDGYTVQMQFDDSGITEAPGNGSPRVNLEGCAPPCHNWSDFDFGNENTINTFWYARRQTTLRTLAIEAPTQCGTPTNLTISGKAYDDVNNSYGRDAAEDAIVGVSVSLHRDANRNGIIDAGETALDSELTDGNGAYSFDNVVVPSAPQTRTQQLSSPVSDGLDYSSNATTWYSQFHAIGDYQAEAGALTGGLRFDELNIPQGATITSATLTFVSNGRFNTGTTEVPIDITIEGIDEDAVAPFSNTNLPRNLTGTDASVVWTAPAAWGTDVTYTTSDPNDPSDPADLKGIIGEIVSRPGYSLGNAIALRLTGSGTNIAYFGSDDDPTKAPVLTVEYTAPELPAQYIVRLDPTSAPAGYRLASNETQTSTFNAADGNDETGEFRFARDRDGDSVADRFDVDNDNDGTPDADEDGGTGINPTADADGDGVLNYEDDDDATNTLPAFVDSNNDGVNDVYDFDGDGVPDAYDRDSDNDGVPDLVEAGGTDGDGDGVADDPADADGDGLADSYDNNTTDGPIGSGVDVTSPGTSSLSDPDRDGVSEPRDSDDDGLADMYDLDSDDDSIADVVEAGGPDADGDGVVDGTADADEDGLVDPVDPSHDGPAASTTSAPIPGSPRANADTDGDGLANAIDVDSDNDGIGDRFEAVCSDCAVATGFSDSDTNGNGVDDAFEGLDANNVSGGTRVGTTPVNTDAANGLDYLDTDADGDTFADWAEGFDADGDGEAKNELVAFAAAYEANNGNPGRYDGTDSDADGLPDWMDNQPGTAGYDPAQRPPYLDPGSGFWFDTNGNGLADLVDASAGGTVAPRPDKDGANDRDWRDATTNAVLPVELLSFNVRTQRCEAIVDWAAEEADFSHYVVEASGDGRRFEDAAMLRATNAGGIVTYSTSFATQPGVSYYRLQLVDGDGAVSYSSIVSAVADCATGAKLELYPNPVQSGNYVNVGSEVAATLELRNSAGRVMRVIRVRADNPARVSLAGLARGVYTLTGDSGQATRLVVQ